MTLDTLSEIEWSRIERGLEIAERQKRDGVVISVRALRQLFDEATGANWADQLDEAEEELEEAEDWAETAERELRELRAATILKDSPIGGVK